MNTILLSIVTAAIGLAISSASIADIKNPCPNPGKNNMGNCVIAGYTGPESGCSDKASNFNNLIASPTSSGCDKLITVSIANPNQPGSFDYSIKSEDGKSSCTVQFTWDPKKPTTLQHAITNKPEGGRICKVCKQEGFIFSVNLVSDTTDPCD